MSISPSDTSVSPSHGRTPRQSAEVQQIQQICPYSRIYNFTSQKPTNQHPEPPRWTGSGFGCRHVHDHAPFTLWREEEQRFSFPSADQRRYIFENYHVESILFIGWLLIIKTSNPPSPVIPLTIGCCPCIFVPPQHSPKFLIGDAPYPNHRLQDPCPHFASEKLLLPSKDKMLAILSVLSSRANIRRAYFLPYQFVVELVYGDNRMYQRGSLPGRVAGITTFYHHSPNSFLCEMRSQASERLLDPLQYLPGPRIGPLPQDGTNYLHQPGWGCLTPGMRLSTGNRSASGQDTAAVPSSTSGVLLRKGPELRLTVANRGFGFAGTTSEVFHPSYNEDKIGDVTDRYTEIDVAMVRLTPENLSRFSNASYFQAYPPRRLIESDMMTPGSWYEVDGMSTGLLSFWYCATLAEPLLRPPGHPEIPHRQWRLNPMYRIFGATNSTMVDGVCGAPLVEESTGNVAGFFHRADGEFAICTAVDDLIAEGWEVA